MFNANQNTRKKKNTRKLINLRCDTIFYLMILSSQSDPLNYTVHLELESSYVFVYNEHQTILEAKDGHSIPDVYKCIHKQRKSRLPSDLVILILASTFLLSTLILLLN